MADEGAIRIMQRNFRNRDDGGDGMPSANSYMKSQYVIIEPRASATHATHQMATRLVVNNFGCSPRLPRYNRYYMPA